jgi:hypothetical protein
MADGEITLKLDSETLARVAEAAAASGAEPAAWAEKVLTDAAEQAHWAEAYARADAFDRTGGKTVSVKEAFDKLDRLIDERRAKA